MDLVERASYPSMESLTRALRRWSLECEAVAADAEALGELPVPLVALRRDQRYVVVSAVAEDHVDVLDTRTGSRREARDAFLASWSGLAVVVQASEDSRAWSVGTRLAAARTRRRRIVLATCSALLVAGASIGLARVAGWAAAAFGVLELAGYALSVMLHATSLGTSRLTRALCGVTPRASCAKVLASPAARLGPVEMSDVGVVFFGGGLLALWGSAAAPAALMHTLWVLAGLATLSLPYTVFSLAYQARLGSYCPLCVAVQLILWLEVMLGARWLHVAAPTSGWQPAAALAGVLIAAVAWAALKPRLRAASRADTLALERRRLRRDPARVEALLPEPRSSLPASPLEIDEGPSDAVVTITLYSDLTCEHCAEAHEALSRLLQGGHVRVRHRLFVLYPLDDAAHETARVVAAAVVGGDHTRAAETLEHAFAARRARRRPAVAPVTLGDDADALYQAFIGAVGTPLFAEAPMIYVDDRELPLVLSLEDLEDWIEDRAAATETEEAA